MNAIHFPVLSVRHARLDYHHVSDPEVVRAAKKEAPGGQTVTPGRINRLKEFTAGDSFSPSEIREMAQTIAAQQREIDGLLGLLIEREGSVFAVDLPNNINYVGGEWIGPSGECRAFWTFRTEAEARAAVRAAWEGK